MSGRKVGAGGEPAKNTYSIVINMQIDSGDDAA